MTPSTSHKLSVEAWAGGDDRLLDRYARQRRTVAIEAVQQQTDRNSPIISERDPATRRKSLMAKAYGGNATSAREYGAQLIDDQQRAAGCRN